MRRLVFLSLLLALPVLAGDVRALCEAEPAIAKAQYADADVDHMKGLRASFYVASPPEKTLNVLWDVRKFPEVFQGIDEMNVRSFTEREIVVEFKVDAVLADVRYTLKRSLDPAKRTITWRDVAGDLEAIRGSWKVEPTDDPGVSRVTYASFVSVGKFVPDALVRDLAVGKVEDMVTRVRGVCARAASHVTP